MLVPLSILSIVSGFTKPIQSVRGVWITNVASTAMRSKESVREAVHLCKSKGINSVFVVVWNKGMTTYPSDVLQSYIGIRQDPSFGGFDPLAEFVTEGHKAGLKVHAWFEFGFSYSYGSYESPWTQRYPHWVAKDSVGNPVVKNGFYWWSAIHPKPKEFLTKLCLEVVEKYDVDGIQGDDRLPAMPSEGGYEPFTKELYRRETDREAPSNTKDREWLQWRADKISEFAKTIYRTVKQKRPDCLVSWSPSPFPWGKEEYLQDWVKWLNEGYADMVFPQLYRYDAANYRKLIQELNTQLTPEQKQRVFPGVLAALGGGYRIHQGLLRAVIQVNRENGYKGECFFFEILKEPIDIYADKATRR